MVGLGKPPAGRPRAGLCLAVFAAAIAVLVVGSAARAGDPDLAKFLLQHGKEALEKGNAADALTKLEKAKQEDPTLVEVIYWIGAALEARGDPPGAVEQYRAFVEALAARGADALPKELSALQKKAQARMDVLDAARREIDRAHDAFAAQILEFAGRLKKDDPDLAARALRLLLAVKPAHAAGSAMLAGLTTGYDDTTGPFRGLTDMWDLIASHGFGKNESWTYVENRIDIRQSKGTLTRTPGGYDSGPTYAMEVVAARESIPVPGRAAVVGLTFGWVDDEGYTLLMLNDELVFETAGKRGRTLLAKKALPAWPASARRTLAVRVEGKHVTGYLEGRPLIEKDVDGRAHLGGDIGVVVENGVLAFHRLVFGRPAAGGK